MKIVIPSRGRWSVQTTLASLPESIHHKVVLLVPKDEFSAYQKYAGLVQVLATPSTIRGISDKRQWIVEQYDPKVCMVDDDLVFAMRRLDDPTKFRPATGNEVSALFSSIEAELDNYAHIGVSGREGANRNTAPFLSVGRMTRILAYRTDILAGAKLTFDRLQFMQDFDMTLQLLRLGYPNLIINWMVQNQNGSNLEGGCSTLRTPEAHAQAAKGLATLHPDFVTVVKKTTKTAWGGGERTDVRVQWKQAYGSAGVVRSLGK